MLIFYNPPSVFWGLWNSLKSLLPEVTRNKIKVIDPSDLQELQEVVPPEVGVRPGWGRKGRQAGCVRGRERLCEGQEMWQPQLHSIQLQLQPARLVEVTWA